MSKVISKQTKQRVKFLRESTDLKQYEIAKVVGIGQASVSRILNEGERKVVSKAGSSREREIQKLHYSLFAVATECLKLSKIRFWLIVALGISVLSNIILLLGLFI